LGAAAVGVSLVLTSAAIGTTPDAEVASLDAVVVPNSNSGLLTITVYGPNASVDIPCVTTSDRAVFDRLHVTPDEMMDALHQWCSPLLAS
jgi:hypothetical protein